MGSVRDSEWSIKPFNDDIDTQALKQEWEEWLEAFEFEVQTKGEFSQLERFNLLMTKGGRSVQRTFKNQKPIGEEILELKVPLKEIPVYDNAVARLNNFYVGKTNVRLEKEIFRAIRQERDENFNKFLLRLRSQARRCQFGTKEEEEILHQVIAGAHSEKVRDKGVDTEITLDKLSQYAINREVLDKEKKKKTNSDEMGEVSAIRHVPSKRFKSDQICGRCGANSHATITCRAKQMRCYKCNMMGHLARACRGRSFTKRETGGKREVNYYPKQWKMRDPNEQAEVRNVDLSPSSDWVVDVPKIPCSKVKGNGFDY